MFRGLMIMHQRVQMAPVAMRAPFCVRESFSAGREKSEIPAITRPHCLRRISLCPSTVMFIYSQDFALV